MKKRISIIIVIVIIIQFSIVDFCAKYQDISDIKIINANQTYHNKYVPADGKTMLFIGQDDSEVADYISGTGITPAGMMIYTNLSDLSAMASSYQGTGNNQAGRMDFQDWITRYPDTAMNLAIWASDETLLRAISNGNYDNNIRTLTRYIRNSGKPVYVRFGYEFDGPWNDYSPGLYISAYRHFVDVVRSTEVEGTIDNISFVWHSAAFFRWGVEWEIWPGINYNRDAVEEYLDDPVFLIDNWYPGDDYVDWVGISWFAWPHEYQERAASIRRDEAVAFANVHHKPVMIAEAAPKEVWQPNNPSKCCCDNGNTCNVGETGFTHTGDSWDNWYQPMFDYIEEHDIKALSYINQDWNAQQMWRNEGGWGDSRVQRNAGILTKWKNKINESRYLMSSDTLYSEIGFNPNGNEETTIEETSAEVTTSGEVTTFEDTTVLEETTADTTTSEETTVEGTASEVTTVEGTASEVTTQTPATDPDFKISSKTLALSSGISLIFKVKGTLFDGMYTNPKLIVNLNGIETEINDYTIDDNGRYAFEFNKITPDKMNVMVNATLHAYQNGKEYVSSGTEYSVATYCYNMLNKYGETAGCEKLRTLLVDLLNYGTASQDYTGFNSDNSANGELTATQRSWASGELGELTSVKNNKYVIIDNPSVTWKTSGLALQDAVIVKMKFQTDSTDGLFMRVRDDYGMVWDIESKDFELAEGTTNQYYVTFKGFHVGRMSDSMYFTAYRGNTPVSNTYRYSVESYVSQHANDGDTLGSLVTAMMKYGKSAKAYIS